MNHLNHSSLTIQPMIISSYDEMRNTFISAKTSIDNELIFTNNHESSHELISNCIKVLNRSPLTGLIFIQDKSPILVVRKSVIIDITGFEELSESSDLFFDFYNLVKNQRTWSALLVNIEGTK
jgi:hypothetical protein